MNDSSQFDTTIPSPSSAPMRVTSTELIQQLDISPDALLVVDQAGTIVMANEQAAALFGYYREELQQPLELSIREEVESHSALLSVRDRGIGIPLQQQARIFGRFVRAENARATEITGTGLGLYLSRELVERHGGRLWFESIEGVGSIFFMTLPMG